MKEFSRKLNNCYNCPNLTERNYSPGLCDFPRKCKKSDRILKDCKIPEWCPLPDVEKTITVDISKFYKKPELPSKLNSTFNGFAQLRPMTGLERTNSQERNTINQLINFCAELRSDIDKLKGGQR